MTMAEQTATERLTGRQADVLGIVAEQGPATASEIGEYHLPIGSSSARSTLTALERRGLVAANYTSGKRGRAYDVTRRGSAALMELHGSEDSDA